MAGKRKVSDKSGTAGPPEKYTQALGDEICERVASGEALAEICKEDHMPSVRTTHRWRQHHPSFYDAFARARVEQQFSRSDEITMLADNATADYRTVVDVRKHGGELTYEEIDGDHVYTFRLPKNVGRLKAWLRDGGLQMEYDRRNVERARLQINTRQWLMERENKEAFSTKSQIDVNHQVEALTDADLIPELAAAMVTAGVSIEELAEEMEKIKGEMG